MSTALLWLIHWEPLPVEFFSMERNRMKVQLNTDKNIQGDEALTNHVETVVDGALGRFRNQISRIEVHLSDVNAGKSGATDKRCVMEARLEGHASMVASDDAGTVGASINGAAGKLQRQLDSALGKLAH